MSSLTTDKSGKTVGYNIQWCEDGHRYTIYLGGRWYSKKTAEACKECIDALLYYRRNGIITPDRKVEDWLKSADAHILAKLAKAGLYSLPETPATKTWQEILCLFIEARKDFKPSTLANYRFFQKVLYKTFSPTDCISELTSKDLKKWKESLATEHNPGGVANLLKVMNTVLNWAVEFEWLTKNPMDNVHRERVINREHHRLISMEEYAKLLAACPTQEWRTIMALARIGGVRCPSEIRFLRWGNINWPENQFLVQSPKTERYAKHHNRAVPLFKELREELERHFDLLKPDDNDFIIQMYQGRKHWVLNGPFNTIAKSAGFEKIAHPFINMRRSRCNEVLDAFGEIKESIWMGHSLRVMKNHYLILTNEDYTKAASFERPMPSPEPLQ